MLTAEKMHEKLSLLSFDVNPQEMAQLTHFLEGIFLWNRAYNLTAIKNMDEAIVKHILDSLVLKPYLMQRKEAGRIIDVGSGAGLPGIPLSIVMPDFQFTLLDSSVKRARFMQQMKLELNLQNIEIIHSRVQDFMPPLGYDLILSRAFASANDMILWSSHLLRENGYFAAMKGRYDEEEWENIVDYPNIEVVVLDVPKLNEERHLIFISK